MWEPVLLGLRMCWGPRGTCLACRARQTLRELVGAVLVVLLTTGLTCRLSPRPHTLGRGGAGTGLPFRKCQHGLSPCLLQIPGRSERPIGEEGLKGKCQAGTLPGWVPRHRPVSLPSCPVLPTLHPVEPRSPFLWGCLTRVAGNRGH